MTHERIREANVSHGQCVLKQKCISRNGWRKRRHGAQKKKEKEERKKNKQTKTNMGGGQADIYFYETVMDVSRRVERERG